MRIIAGEYKGQKVQPVPTQLTRPTGDKIKEALFQMIGPFFEGGLCLDLFAGSGSLGIEALSRGMDKTIFVDKQQKAIAVIHQNVYRLSLKERSEIYRNDAFKALKVLNKRDLQFKLIFIDPPYQKVSYQKILNAITENNLVESNGIIVCEHDPNVKFFMEKPEYKEIKREIYSNTTAITIFQKDVTNID